MTQIATYRVPSRAQGPQGIGASSAGGAYSRDGQSDLHNADSFLAGINELSGTTDAIISPEVPSYPNNSRNFIVKTAGVDAITLFAPTAGVHDNLTVNIWSDTANAHTVTTPTAVIAAGAALASVITFKAFRGSGVTLRAFNGVWQVISQNVTSIA